MYLSPSNDKLYYMNDIIFFHSIYFLFCISKEPRAPWFTFYVLLMLTLLLQRKYWSKTQLHIYHALIIKANVFKAAASVFIAQIMRWKGGWKCVKCFIPSNEILSFLLINTKLAECIITLFMFGVFIGVYSIWNPEFKDARNG